MLIQATVEKMNAMKLSAMAEAFERQLASSEYAELSFEERVGLMVDTEWTARENRKLARRLRGAKMRHAACIEDINFKAPRGLNRQQVLTLGSCAWVGARHNVIVIGPTGIGKSYLSCAFVERACRKGFNAQYARAPRLLHELAVGRGDGSYTRLLARLAKLDLLAIDDWLLAPLKEPERRDLMEVIEDRAERASTLIASQLPIKDWHGLNRRPEPGRCPMRPAPSQRPPLRAQRTLDAPDSHSPQRSRRTEGGIPGRPIRGRTACGQGVNVAASGERVDNRRDNEVVSQATSLHRCPPVDHTHSPLAHTSS
ncbi:MAG: ATP-binding protein [Gammaproteobacteria bacterium]